MAPAFSVIDHLALVGAPYDTPTRRAGEAPQFALGWSPKNDCLFVLQLQEADMSVGGLVLPDETRKPPSKGIVLAIGAGLWDAEQRQMITIEASVGDLVTFGEYSGEKFDIEGVELLIVRNVEIKARKPAGTFTLTEHHLDEGGLHDRFLYHEPHVRCEHCPKPVSEVIEEERARLQAGHKAALSHEGDVIRTLGDVIRDIEAEDAKGEIGEVRPCATCGRDVTTWRDNASAPWCCIICGSTPRLVRERD